MSNAAPNGRPVFSGVEASGSVPIEYRFSHAKNGNRHLLVVFANLGAPGEWGWANGVLDKTRANILWIRDQFDGQNSYYLCKGMDFSLERSVIELISRVMNALSLTPDDCTMFGSSKGGTAALYFGLKYGFRNVVASVPQFRVGTYVKESMPGAARLMMGEVTDEKVHILDSVLPSVVGSGTYRDANIYLISSPQDEQYTRHVEPFLGLFQGYTNFNFVYNDSPLIASHGKVTLRNLPTIMGLLNLLVDGIAPRIGVITNGQEQPERDTSAIDSYLSSTSQMRGDTFSAPVVSTPVPHQEVPGNAVRFVGSAPGAVRVSMWENGKYLGSSQVLPDGSWSWAPDRTWAGGKHVIRLFAVDANKFHSARTEVAFTVQAQGSPSPGPHAASGGQFPGQQTATPSAPAPVISVPAPGQQVPGPVIGLMGYAQGAVHVEFMEEGMPLGMAPVAPDSSWSWESGWSWTEGPHTVECHAVDMGGNKSQRTAVTFSVVNAYASPAPAQHLGY
ncbi:hypothetical protein ABZS93_17320 [Streptomyces sp900116325]|uniref:hypothetical protein n=1 Tax=Streptomyces sp. 900116325 TaxID=3154295 RepID=UPI0033BE7348